MIKLWKSCGATFAAIGLSLFSWPATAGTASPASIKIVKESCGICHSLAKGAPNGEGPNLFGIVGRVAGTANGYSYTADFARRMKGKKWTPNLLDKWLTDTTVLVPGGGMVYFEQDPKKRQAIIDYIKSLN
jgi:cytochrome c